MDFHKPEFKGEKEKINVNEQRSGRILISRKEDKTQHV